MTILIAPSHSHRHLPETGTERVLLPAHSKCQRNACVTAALQGGRFAELEVRNPTHSGHSAESTLPGLWGEVGLDRMGEKGQRGTSCLGSQHPGVPDPCPDLLLTPVCQNVSTCSPVSPDWEFSSASLGSGPNQATMVTEGGTDRDSHSD